MEYNRGRIIIMNNEPEKEKLPAKNQPMVFMLDENDRKKLRSLAREQGLSDAAYVRQILLAAWERERLTAEAYQARQNMIGGPKP
jgi:precorrin-2 methylase